MSFCELRQFVETMKLLGFRRLISMESFRTPNFVYVREILVWLMQRHDPLFEVTDDIETEKARIRFLREIGEHAYTRLHIKLNLRKLYMADGHAVQELLKLSTVLAQALELRSSDEPFDASRIQGPNMNPKECRSIAAELTHDGAKLFELLANDQALREARNKVIFRPQDHQMVDKALQGLQDDLVEQKGLLSTNLEGLTSDEQNLEAKLMSKRQQLDRLQKRLDALELVRPAFMDAYEEAERELQTLFSSYLEHCRNLEYLDAEVRKFVKVEEELVEEQQNRLRVLRERLKREGDRGFDDAELMRARMTADADDAIALDDDATAVRPPAADYGGKRPIGSRGGRRPQANAAGGGNRFEVRANPSKSGDVWGGTDDDDDDDGGAGWNAGDNAFEQSGSDEEPKYGAGVADDSDDAEV